jgi:hypothetical protein
MPPDQVEIERIAHASISMARGDERSLCSTQFQTENRFTLFLKLLFVIRMAGVEEKQAEERFSARFRRPGQMTGKPGWRGGGSWPKYSLKAAS